MIDYIYGAAAQGVMMERTTRANSIMALSSGGGGGDRSGKGSRRLPTQLILNWLLVEQRAEPSNNDNRCCATRNFRPFSITWIKCR